MPQNERFVSTTGLDGWSVDTRGYIHGGFETPEFLKVKQRHNRMLTKSKRANKTNDKPVTIIRAVIAIDPDGTKRKYVQPVAFYGDAEFTNPTKKES